MLIIWLVVQYLRSFVNMYATLYDFRWKSFEDNWNQLHSNKKFDVENKDQWYFRYCRSTITLFPCKYVNLWQKRRFWVITLRRNIKHCGIGKVSPWNWLSGTLTIWMKFVRLTFPFNVQQRKRKYKITSLRSGVTKQLRKQWNFYLEMKGKEHLRFGWKCFRPTFCQYCTCSWRF